MERTDSFIIKTTGEIVPVVPENGTDFTLKEAQGFVNDCVEVVYDNGDTCMIASENAFDKGFLYNPAATVLANENLNYDILILGDVLVCKSSMFK